MHVHQHIDARASTPHGLRNILKDTGLFANRSISDGDLCYKIHDRIYWSFAHNSLRGILEKISRGDNQVIRRGAMRWDNYAQSIYVQTTGGLHRFCEKSMCRQVMVHKSKHLMICYVPHWKSFQIRPCSRASISLN
ncbi:hypothetical protein AVEN_182653-1 [Araneus ventricosus]|uniref:Uncharacterized protein n=1 Tax=Araneus ventricosus TaxID=182803 RepID=A0A4Y2WHX3_ARAVE|nr:hypothetical protein AVEN_172098-1 [Araneus ventricosus]GBO37153.1 hypothetical protein AVEN_182653-1 [Araneus ventricosus]